MPRKPPAARAIQAAIYLRVSTGEQVQGYGLAVQRQRCLAMAQVKSWTVAREHIFADEGISGTLGPSKRPALQALLQLLGQGEVQAVIVLALDRLGRSTRVVLDVVQIIATAGAELLSCKESLDTSTPAGRFVLTMFAALAELERENIVARTTAGRDARGLVDGDRGGRVPFGYLRSEQGIEVDYARAEIVRRIFQAHRRRDSLRRIADRLNQEGYPTPQGGQVWYPATVRLILANAPAYKGAKRGQSEAAWPGIL